MATEAQCKSVKKYKEKVNIKQICPILEMFAGLACLVFCVIFPSLIG